MVPQSQKAVPAALAPLVPALRSRTTLLLQRVLRFPSCHHHPPEPRRPVDLKARTKRVPQGRPLSSAQAALLMRHRPPTCLEPVF